MTEPIAVYRHAETGLVVEHVRNVMVRKAYQPLCRVVEPGTSTYRKGELAMVNAYGEGWERVSGD